MEDSWKLKCYDEQKNKYIDLLTKQLKDTGNEDENTAKNKAEELVKELFVILQNSNRNNNEISKLDDLGTNKWFSDHLTLVINGYQHIDKKVVYESLLKGLNIRNTSALKNITKRENVNNIIFDGIKIKDDDDCIHAKEAIVNLLNGISIWDLANFIDNVRKYGIESIQQEENVKSYEHGLYIYGIDSEWFSEEEMYLELDVAVKVFYELLNQKDFKGSCLLFAIQTAKNYVIKQKFLFKLSQVSQMASLTDEQQKAQQEALQKLLDDLKRVFKSEAFTRIITIISKVLEYFEKTGAVYFINAIISSGIEYYLLKNVHIPENLIFAISVLAPIENDVSNWFIQNIYKLQVDFDDALMILYKGIEEEAYEVAKGLNELNVEIEKNTIRTINDICKRVIEVTQKCSLNFSSVLEQLSKQESQTILNIKIKN